MFKKKLQRWETYFLHENYDVVGKLHSQLQVAPHVFSGWEYRCPGLSSPLPTAIIMYPLISYQPWNPPGMYS